MEFHQLQSFVAVAEEGNLTRASGRLYVSQPAVSAHIKTLEEELGVQLFRRTPKGMVLTERGGVLLQQARRTLGEAEQIRAQARALHDEVAGVVRIGLNSGPDFLKTAGLATELTASHPRLEVRFSGGHTSSICGDVLRRDLDAGFVYGDVPQPELAALRLHTQRLVIVGPSAWGERLNAADWAELAELPWVWVPVDCPFHALADAEFTRRGLRPARQLEADNEPILLSLVASGAGLSLVSEVEAGPAERAGAVSIWPGGHMGLDLHFIHLEQRRDDPLIRAAVGGVRRVWAPDG